MGNTQKMVHHGAAVTAAAAAAAGPPAGHHGLWSEARTTAAAARREARPAACSPSLGHSSRMGRSCMQALPSGFTVWVQPLRKCAASSAPLLRFAASQSG